MIVVIVVFFVEFVYDIEELVCWVVVFGVLVDIFVGIVYVYCDFCNVFMLFVLFEEDLL